MKNVITKIEMQKKNKDRVNIYINDEFAFPCDAQLIYIHNIAKGKEVDKQDLENIVFEDNYIKGKNLALNFLEKSFKSEKQVYDKLILKEFDNKTIDRIMAFLKQYEFIDDCKFVQLYVRDKIKTSGKGKIKFTLLRKGISEELIKEQLDSVTSEQQLEVALKLAEKKYKLLCKSEKDINKIQKKIGDYLVRNGYDFELTNQVLKQVIIEDEIQECEEQGASEEDYDSLYELASKRYSILIKSEKQEIKLYKKLGDYLLRRGFQWEQIKKVLKDIIKSPEDR